MEALTKKIAARRQQLTHKNFQVVASERIVGEIIKKELGERKKITVTVSFQKDRLILETNNKTSANELFLIRRQILNALKQVVAVTGLVIR